MNEILQEASRFDADYQPAENYNFLPSIDKVPDGVGLFEIRKVEVVYRGKEKQPVLCFQIQGLTGPAAGILFEKPYYLDDQKNIDRLGRDLCQLGFDADKWRTSNKRPFMYELDRHLTKLPGIRFQGEKETWVSQQDNKPHGSLRIHGVVSGAIPMPTASPAPARPAPSAAPANNRQPEPAGVGPSGEIPFAPPF